MDAAARLPPTAAPAILEGAPAPAPGGGRPIQFVDVQPPTPDGRVHLFPAIETRGGLYHYEPDPATARYPLSLISPASEHTISSTLGELRPGIARVKIHPDDAHVRSIAEGDAVRLFNELGDVHCEASVTPEIRPGTLSLKGRGRWLGR